MLVDAYRCVCGNRGTRFYYDPNPKDLPPLKDHPTCLMGATFTGEPGAIRCMGCDGLEGEAVEADGQVEVGDEEPTRLWRE